DQQHLHPASLPPAPTRPGSHETAYACSPPPRVSGDQARTGAVTPGGKIEFSTAESCRLLPSVNVCRNSDACHKSDIGKRSCVGGLRSCEPVEYCLSHG